jgi:hypothetical protein
MDMRGISEDAARGRTVGRADALQGRGRADGAGPVSGTSSRWGLQGGPDDAGRRDSCGDAATGAVACGIKGHRLEVLDQDWEAAFFVEKCPGCFAAVVARD